MKKLVVAVLCLLAAGCAAPQGDLSARDAEEAAYEIAGVGYGAAQGVISTVGGLTDVNVAGASTNDLLRLDATGDWVDTSALTVASGSTGLVTAFGALLTVGTTQLDAINLGGPAGAASGQIIFAAGLPTRPAIVGPSDQAFSLQAGAGQILTFTAGTLDIDTASGVSSFGIGAGADAGTGTKVTVVGEDSIVGDTDKVTVFGFGNAINGDSTVAVGNNISTTTSVQCVLVGAAVAHTGAQRTVLIGATATGDDSNGAGVGYLVVLNGSRATALGASASVTADAGMALGANSASDHIGAISVGRSSQSTATHQATIGGIHADGYIDHLRIVEANGATTGLRSATALLSGVSGGTLAASNLIPDGAALIGVSTYIVTELGTGNGTSGYTVGTVADPDRWAADVGAITVGTFSDNSDATADARGFFTSAADVLITFVGGNADGTGAIRIVAHYHSIGAPTQ